jgi:hypothetical protein
MYGNVTPLAAAAEAILKNGRRVINGPMLMLTGTHQLATPELRLRKVDQEASGSTTRTAKTTGPLSAPNQHPDTSHSAAPNATRVITSVMVVKERSQLAAKGATNGPRPISQSRALFRTPQTRRRATTHGGTILTSLRAAHPSPPPTPRGPASYSQTEVTAREALYRDRAQAEADEEAARESAQSAKRHAKGPTRSY